MICKDFSATPVLGGLFLIVNKNSILGATGPRQMTRNSCCSMVRALEQSYGGFRLDFFPKL